MKSAKAFVVLLLLLAGCVGRNPWDAAQPVNPPRPRPQPEIEIALFPQDHSCKVLGDYATEMTLLSMRLGGQVASGEITDARELHARIGRGVKDARTGTLTRLEARTKERLQTWDKAKAEALLAEIAAEFNQASSLLQGVPLP